MATFSKRKKKWLADVRKSGIRTTKVFSKKRDARRWASEMEQLIERGEYHKTKRLTLTLEQAIDKYITTVSITKDGEKEEIQRFNVIKKFKWLVDMNLGDIEGVHIAQFRDERLDEVKSSTVNRDLNLLSPVFTTAIKEWSMPISNPVLLITRPKVPPKPLQDRHRINKEEETRIIAACKASSHEYLAPIFCFALETSLRRGALCALMWDDVDIDAHRVFIRHSKTDDPRTVPLTKRAVEILRGLRVHESGLVFPFVSPNAMSTAFRRACAAAKSLDGTEDKPITGVRFHDTRHEATSRLFCKLKISPKVKMVTGHKTDRVLADYTDLLDEVLEDLG